VLAYARDAALFAPVFLAVVLADARSAAWNAVISFAVVLADARPAALLTLCVSLAVVLADGSALFPHRFPPCPLPPAPTIREALAEHASDIVYVPSGANYLAHQTSGVGV
jgi:hypothetical protein